MPGEAKSGVAGVLGGVYERGALAFLVPVSPLHVGSGRDTSCRVDLPIQRDSLGYPIIWGSSVKGSLRSSLHLRCYRDDKGHRSNESNGCQACVELLFGNERESAGGFFAGSVYVPDHRLLAISGPCSLGVCFYTSGELLARFVDALELFSEGIVRPVSGEHSWFAELREEVKKLVSEVATRILVSSSFFEEAGSSVVLGNEIFDTGELVVLDQLEEVFRKVFSIVFKGGRVSLVSDYSRRVVVLPDSIAQRMIGRHLVPTRTRIALDYRTKTVREGALWTEEYVPELSIFYGVYLFSRPRVPGPSESGDKGSKEPDTIKNCRKYTGKIGECGARISLDNDVFDLFACLYSMKDLGENTRLTYLMLGGNETVGMGLARLVFRI